MKSAATLIVTALAAMLAPPARAEVFQKAENGFVIRTGADVEAAPDAAWRALVNPSDWWSADHTYSGDAANLSLDPRVEGCFCELLPNPDSPNAAPRGHVEHMRVIFIDRARTLRLSGALGPLQAQALTGTLTISMKPLEQGGTRILWEYVVGGYMRFKTDEIAPAVDAVLVGQLASLARKLGLKAPIPPAVAPPAEAPPTPPPPATGQHPTEIGR